MGETGANGELTEADADVLVIQEVDYRMDSGAQKALWWVILAALLFSIGTTFVRFYVRQEIATSEATRCRSCYAILRWDKRDFAEEQGLTNGSVIDPVAFAKFQTTNNPRSVIFSKCPSGGSYSVNPVGVDPTCSYTNEFGYWSINLRELKFYHSKTRHPH